MSTDKEDTLIGWFDPFTCEASGFFSWTLRNDPAIIVKVTHTVSKGNTAKVQKYNRIKHIECVGELGERKGHGHLPDQTLCSWCACYNYRRAKKEDSCFTPDPTRLIEKSVCKVISVRFKKYYGKYPPKYNQKALKGVVPGKWIGILNEGNDK